MREGKRFSNSETVRERKKEVEIEKRENIDRDRD